MALAGITCVGEFHYLHHGPGGTPLRRPERDGRRADRGRRRGRHPDHAARHALPDRPTWTASRWRACSCGSATATSTAGRRGPTRCAPRPARAGRRGRCTRCGRCRPAASADVRARAPTGRPLHVHLSEQRAENEACLAVHGRTPTELLADAGVLGPAHHRGARHPPHRRATAPRSATPAPASASARPPSATWPTASARPGAGRRRQPAVPRQRQPRGDRPVRGGARGGAARAAAHRAARPLHRRRAARRGDRRRARGARLARRRRASPSAPGPTWSRCALDTVRTAGCRPGRGGASRPPPPTSPRGRRRPGRGPRRPAPARADVAGRAGATRSRRCWHERCWSTNIGELVTNDPARRRAARHAPRRRARGRGRPGRLGRAAPRTRRPPTRGSTPTARAVLPGLRGQPRPPGVRRRPGGRVRRPDGRRAVHRRRHPHHGRGHPRRRATTSCAPTSRRLRRRGAAAGHHHHRDQERVRADRRRRGPVAADRPASSPTRPRSSAPTSCRPSTPAGRTTTSALVCGPMLAAAAPYARWVDVFCERGAFDGDQARAVLTAGHRGRARRRGCTPTSSAPGRACGSRSSSARPAPTTAPT